MKNTRTTTAPSERKRAARKARLTGLLVGVLSILLLFCRAAATDVIIDGVPVVFTQDTGYPFIENGRTLVPLRATMEAFGAEVRWDEAQRAALVTKGEITVVCRIGENCVWRNGTRIENDAASLIRDGRTYLPIRIVLEALDAKVDWDGNVLVDSGGTAALIYRIENSGLHVKNMWKSWTDALELKNAGEYARAVEAIKTLAPDFLKASDTYSDAMLYKHLGECYAALGQNAEAVECFHREAVLWTLVGYDEDAIDANRRAALMNSYVQIYAKTEDASYQHRYGVLYEPENGVYLGAYAEGDPAVHDANSMDTFYMNEFPKLVGRDMAAYLLYLPSDSPLSVYESHLAAAKEKNKLVQIALEPSDIRGITENDPAYIRLAQDMEASGVKLLVRFASEMNDVTCPWYTGDPALFIEKFRFVADVFHRYAPSVPVVWSPNFYPESTIESYYPGDEYVDYVGMSAYKFYQPETDPLGKGVDRSRYAEMLNALTSLYGYKKPIIVSEGASSYRDVETGEDITEFAAAQLYDFLVYLPIKYPQLKAMFLFDSDRPNIRYALSGNKTYFDAYVSGIRNERYLSRLDDTTAVSYYELGNNAAVKAGETELSAYVRTVENDVAYVVYRIGDVDAGVAYAAPYSATVDLSAYAGQTVNISALAFDTAGMLCLSKTYAIKVTP